MRRAWWRFRATPATRGSRSGSAGAEQYEVIPAYVDYAPDRPGLRPGPRRGAGRAGLPADAEVVGWVGRFMPQKDPATLAARGARSCSPRGPELHACFVGDGPLRGEVERELRSAAASLDRAHFAGFRSDVRRLYPAFDVLLHTSRWEGQPRVIQEAVAERVPVVTARVAGHRETCSGPRRWASRSTPATRPRSRRGRPRRWTTAWPAAPAAGAERGAVARAQRRGAGAAAATCELYERAAG